MGRHQASAFHRLVMTSVQLLHRRENHSKQSLAVDLILYVPTARLCANGNFHGISPLSNSDYDMKRSIEPLYHVPRSVEGLVSLLRHPKIPRILRRIPVCFILRIRSRLHHEGKDGLSLSARSRAQQWVVRVVFAGLAKVRAPI